MSVSGRSSVSRLDKNAVACDQDECFHGSAIEYRCPRTGTKILQCTVGLQQSLSQSREPAASAAAAAAEATATVAAAPVSGSQKRTFRQKVTCRKRIKPEASGTKGRRNAQLKSLTKAAHHTEMESSSDPAQSSPVSNVVLPANKKQKVCRDSQQPVAPKVKAAKEQRKTRLKSMEQCGDADAAKAPVLCSTKRKLDAEAPATAVPARPVPSQELEYIAGDACQHIAVLMLYVDVTLQTN